MATPRTSRPTSARAVATLERYPLVQSSNSPRAWVTSSPTDGNSSVLLFDGNSRAAPSYPPAFRPSRPSSARTAASVRGAGSTASSSPRGTVRQSPYQPSPPSEVPPGLFTEADVEAVVESVSAQLRESCQAMLQAQEHRYERMLHRLYHLMRAKGSAEEGLDYSACRREADDAAHSQYEATTSGFLGRSTATAGKTFDDANASHAIVRLQRQFDRIASKHDRSLAQTTSALQASNGRMRDTYGLLKHLELADAAALAAEVSVDHPLGKLLGSFMAERMAASSHASSPTVPSAPALLSSLLSSAPRRRADDQKTASGVRFASAAQTTTPFSQPPVVAAAATADAASSEAGSQLLGHVPDMPSWTMVDLRARLDEMAGRIDDVLARTADPVHMRELVKSRRRTAAMRLMVNRDRVTEAAIAEAAGELFQHPTSGRYCFTVACQCDAAPRLDLTETLVPSPMGGESSTAWGRVPRADNSSPELSPLSARARSAARQPTPGTLFPGTDRLGVAAMSPEPSDTPHLATGADADPNWFDAFTQTTAAPTFDAQVQADAAAIDHAAHTSVGLFESIMGMSQRSGSITHHARPPRSAPPSAVTRPLEATDDGADGGIPEAAESMIGSFAAMPTHLMGTPSADPLHSPDTALADGDDRGASASPALVESDSNSPKHGTKLSRLQRRASEVSAGSAATSRAAVAAHGSWSKLKRRVQTRDAEVTACLGKETLEPLALRERRVDELQATFNRLFFALSTTAQSLMLFTDGYEADLVCRCCFQLIERPSLLWPCGHSFCAACIEREMGLKDNVSGDRIYKCKDCGAICREGHTPNITLSTLAARWSFKKRTVNEPRETMEALRDALVALASPDADGELSARLTHTALHPPTIAI
jgi:hypothetical protein